MEQTIEDLINLHGEDAIDYFESAEVNEYIELAPMNEF